MSGKKPPCFQQTRSINIYCSVLYLVRIGEVALWEKVGKILKLSTKARPCASTIDRNRTSISEWVYVEHVADMCIGVYRLLVCSWWTKCKVDEEVQRHQYLTLTILLTKHETSLKVNPFNKSQGQPVYIEWTLILYKCISLADWSKGTSASSHSAVWCLTTCRYCISVISLNNTQWLCYWFLSRVL